VYNKQKAIFMCILTSILTLGIVGFLSLWFIKLKLFLMYTKIDESEVRWVFLELYFLSKLLI